VESPSLEIFQTRLDAVLCSLLWVTLLRQGVGLGDPQRSLPTSTILGFCEIAMLPSAWRRRTGSWRARKCRTLSGLERAVQFGRVAALWRSGWWGLTQSLVPQTESGASLLTLALLPSALEEMVVVITWWC